MKGKISSEFSKEEQDTVIVNGNFIREELRESRPDVKLESEFPFWSSVANKVINSFRAL